MKFLNISCKKATYLVSKKEAQKLSWLEKVRLRGHMTICSLCRRFEAQTALIGRLAKQDHPEVTLSPESKEKMETALKQS